MVGEVITGAVSGAMQGVASAAPAVMEAPIAAVSALPAVIETPIVAMEAAHSAIEVVPDVLTAPLEAAGNAAGGATSMTNVLPTVTNAVTEAAGIVQEGMGDVVRPEITEGLLPKTTGIIGELHAYIQQNDATGALEFLAFGRFQQVQRELGREGEISMDTALRDLQHMLPDHAQNVLQNVQGFNIPKDVISDPEFLQQFMLALQEGDGQVKGDKGASEVAKGMKSHVEISAKKALQRFSGKELTDEDLERLKKEAAQKAAMLEIRQYMNVWRKSVASDKKLDGLAQSLALRRIDLLEAKLLTHEAIKWDGVSVAKLITLAYVWMKEMQEESLPQPKL